MPYQPLYKPTSKASALSILKDERNRALSDTARYVRAKAAKYPPKANSASYKRTGTLGRSIAVGRVQEGPGYASVDVGTNLHYARYVEEGTGIYGPKKAPITPKNAKALAWRSLGKPTGPGARLIASGMKSRKGKLKSNRAKDVYMNFAKSVKGMQPWHYMEKAFKATETEAYFKQRINQMLASFKARAG